MADKWLLPTSSHLWTPYLSHLLPDCFHISYMDYFYQTITQVEYGLCQLTKMASKMATTYQFALVDTNKLSHLLPDFSNSKFHTNTSQTLNMGLV